MSSTFLSQFNIDLLKNTLKEHLGPKIDFDEILINRIQQINSTIDNNNLPSKAEYKKYIIGLNKKVIGSVMNDIISLQRQSMARHREEQRERETSNHVFDTAKQMHLPNNTNVMDRPQVQPQHKQVNTIYNDMKNNREEMFPKQKPIDFSDKAVENERPTNELYENMMKKRETMNLNIPKQVQEVTSSPIQSTPIQSTPINEIMNIANRMEVGEMSNNKRLSNRVEEKKIVKEVPLKNIYVDIDSRFRNLVLNENPSGFEINFQPEQDVFINELKDDNGVIIHNSKRIFLNNRKLDLPGNIREIECINVIAPLESKSWNRFRKKTPLSNNLYEFNLDDGQMEFNEPYLLLNIDELRGKYRSINKMYGNTFAKLIPNKIGKNFVELRPSGRHEVYKGDDIKINKLTLNLMKSNGKKYLSDCDMNKLSKIGECDGFTSISLGTGLERFEVDDLLYFYNNSPKEENVIFFHQNVRVKSLLESNEVEFDNFSNEVIEKGNVKGGIEVDFNGIFVENSELMILNLEVMNGIEDKKRIYSNVDMKYVFQHLLGGELRNIKLNQILKGGVNEYICLSIRVNNNVLNKYFKIIGFNRRGLIILNDENMKFQKKDIMRIGFTRDVVRGTQSDDEEGLFFVGGHKIIGKVNDELILDLKFRGEFNNYKSENVLTIHHKKQINYSFRIGYV